MRGRARLRRQALLRGWRSPHIPAMSPDGEYAYVTDGASGRVAAIALSDLRVDDPGHPQVIGRFSPGYLVHDLRFTPDGGRVWVTAADRSYVGVFSARRHRLLFRVPAGPRPSTPSSRADTRT